ncbi:MAG: hypothetical protein AB4372_39220 [Xenococcus sp. (in: cyanobacteria)]
MTNPTVEVGIADILKDIQTKQDKMYSDILSRQDKIIEDMNSKFEKMESRQDKILEDMNSKFEGMQSRQDKILEEIKEIKVGQAKLEGRIDTLEEKLSGEIKTLDTKVEQLDKRIGNQEFIPIRGQANRSVLVGLIVALLVGVFKMFGY